MSEENNTNSTFGFRGVLYVLTGGLVIGTLAGVGAGYSELHQQEQPVLAQEIGTALEEWAVVHPNEDIPKTDTFVSYASYLDVLDPDESLRPRKLSKDDPEGMMVKIVHKENAPSSAGFIVCAYSEKGFSVAEKRESFSKMYSYDTATDEVVLEDVETCSQ